MGLFIGMKSRLTQERLVVRYRTPQAALLRRQEKEPVHLYRGMCPELTHHGPHASLSSRRGAAVHTPDRDTSIELGAQHVSSVHSIPKRILIFTISFLFGGHFFPLEEPHGRGGLNSRSK